MGTRKSYVIYRLSKRKGKRGEISDSTITNYYKATKLFCIINDLALNWKKISRGLPSGRRATNDRAPTIEEIQKRRLSQFSADK